MQSPQGETAEDRACQRQSRIQELVFFFEPEIDQEDSEAEKEKLHLREDDGSVAAEIFEKRADERDVHAGGYFVSAAAA